MAGINYKKVAEISEGKGNLKKAADFYVRAGDLKKAYSLYEKVLSTTDDWNVKNDIKQRLIRLGHPIHLKKFASEPKNRALERRVYAIASIFSLVAALFFISFNLTGNSIGNLSRDSLSLLGVGFFVLGLITFIFFKSRKK